MGATWGIPIAGGIIQIPPNHQKHQRQGRGQCERYTLRNTSASSAASTEDRPAGKVLLFNIRRETEGRYLGSNGPSRKSMDGAGTEVARKKSSPSRMRLLGLSGGSATNSGSQSQPVGIGYDPLSKGSASDMAVHPSGRSRRQRKMSGSPRERSCGNRAKPRSQSSSFTTTADLLPSPIILAITDEGRDPLLRHSSASPNQTPHYTNALIPFTL